MKIKSVSVKNFRSIKDETLPCEALTALVGANGSGKSSFLKALELFYAPTPKYTADDFYNRETEEPIEVAVTFTGLSSSAKEKFGIYLASDDLAVVRVLSLSVAKYHGVRPQHPGFGVIRKLDKAGEKKPVYEALRKEPGYESLPKWSSENVASKAMEEWEAAHASDCQPARDDGQFFGFTQVANGYLGEYSKLIFIPAVKDAGTEANDQKGTAISELMEIVVRNAILGKEEVKKFQADIQKQYGEIMDPAKMTEMSTLRDALSTTLRTYVPDAGVDLGWIKAQPLELPMPKADVQVIEDGFTLAVARTGHGLQRAFILTLLQHLALAQSRAKGAGGEELPAPSLLLVIEEPELYQHPNRQRHFAKVLLDLAGGRIPGVADQTQVIYCSHSPLMVGLDRFEQVRLLRKHEAAGKPKITKVVQATLDDVAARLWDATDKREPKFTGASLRPRLHTLLTPWMNEGFFADVVVLVEGEDDRAAILAAAKARNRDLETEGIAVIPCSGKSNLDRPAVIFRSLGLPVYVVWDSDSDKGTEGKPEMNRQLLLLNGLPAEDWPAMVSPCCACFKIKLESTLSAEIGVHEFETWLKESQDKHGIPKKKNAIKNPVVLSEVLSRAQAEGKASPTLEQILDAVFALKNGTPPTPEPA